MSVHNATHGAKDNTPNEGMRHRRRAGYYVPRTTIRDESISYVALGVLAYLLDRPRGWRVRGETLAALRGDSERQVMTALAELRAKGYYRLERRRLLSGKFAMGTAISEEPVTEWAADNAEYDGKAVPLEQQSDGSFLVRHKDGALTDDGIGDVDDDVPEPPDPGSPDPRFPGTGNPGTANVGPLRREVQEKKHQEEEKDPLPAVGELQHRKEIPPADLRPGNETPDPSHVPDDEPATAPPVEPAPSTSPLSTLWQTLPDEVRGRIRPNQQQEVIAAIRAELADESRTLAELLERVGRRWLWWKHTGERVGCPVAVAKTLITRRQCADLRCEDGTGLDSGKPCMACADSRPLRSTPAEPITPTAGENPTVAQTAPAPISSMSSSPAARTVAEALAPIPYVDTKTTTPATAPPRSSGGPNAAVAELRARWASTGIQAPNKRPAVERVAAPRVPDSEPDPAAQAARDYLKGRGDNLDLMAAARKKLGNEAPRDEVALLAAQLAGCP